jgi:hypothetical protein
LDETALNFGIGPTYIYIPIDADRAVAEASNVKARITCVPIVTAEGAFLPMMFILKHSKSSDKFPDQTTMRVVKNLNRKEGYTPQDGWHLETWRRSLTIKKGNVEHTNVHCVNYLIHQGTSTSLKQALLIVSTSISRHEAYNY